MMPRSPPLGNPCVLNVLLLDLGSLGKGKATKSHGTSMLVMACVVCFPSIVVSLWYQLLATATDPGRTKHYVNTYINEIMET